MGISIWERMARANALSWGKVMPRERGKLMRLRQSTGLPHVSCTIQVS